MSVQVTLSQSEVIMAAHIGVVRQASSLFKHRENQHGIDPHKAWQAHIEGACGELVVAKYLETYWPACLNTFREHPDLANNGREIEVKTRSKDHYDLMVRRDDPQDREYWLVTGLSPTFWVHGFILGKDARRPEWVQHYGGRPAAWFVPQSALTLSDDCEGQPFFAPGVYEWANNVAPIKKNGGR